MTSKTPNNGSAPKRRRHYTRSATPPPTPPLARPDTERCAYGVLAARRGRSQQCDRIGTIVAGFEFPELPGVNGQPQWLAVKLCAACSAAPSRVAAVRGGIRRHEVPATIGIIVPPEVS